MNKAAIAMAVFIAWCAGGMIKPEARSLVKAAEEKPRLLPLTYGKGELQEFKDRLDAKPDHIHTLSKIEFADNAFWVIDMHLGDGESIKVVALYAPEKDGSHRQCLFADSMKAGHLNAEIDEKSGNLELREAANSNLKGEVILSCNLKSIGTQHSTRKRE
jgi:hypothetical protein